MHRQHADRSAPGTPGTIAPAAGRPGAGRRRLGRLALVVALLLALVVGCSGTDQGAATGPRTTKPETTTNSSTTSTTEAPAPPPTEVATATVPQIEVFATIPEPEAAATAPADPTPPTATQTAVPPIPREGYRSAGVATTPDGWRFDNPTFFGNPLVFVVTAEHEGWLRVLLPARPNEQQGWIRAGDVTRSSHPYRIELDLSDRYLQAYEGNAVIAETPVVIGAPGTPTPTGTYFLTEALPYGGGANPGGAYGAWILPTNGYSEAMTEFDGGLPVIALHGTNNPGAVGTAISNGCVRLPDPIISTIAERMPPGTPVHIVE